MTYILSVLSARFQLENQSAPAWLGSARNLHSSGSLEPENSSSNSSLVRTYLLVCKYSFYKWNKLLTLDITIFGLKMIFWETENCCCFLHFFQYYWHVLVWLLVNLFSKNAISFMACLQFLLVCGIGLQIWEFVK